MQNLLQNNYVPVSSGRLRIILVNLLDVVTYPWKLHCYHVVLVGYGPVFPKFSEITNWQYLWKGLSDFVGFLHVVICILLISLEATIICYFGLALSGIGSQPIRLSDVLNLKNMKTVWGDKSIFCFHWSYKKYAILDYDPQNTLGQSVCRIFYFWLVWIVNFNTGGLLLHCNCSFRHLCYFHFCRNH